MNKSAEKRKCVNHKALHEVKNKPENEHRIWACEECITVFSDKEARKDAQSEKWGHLCRARKYRTETRCESHLIPFIPYLPEEL